MHRITNINHRLSHLGSPTGHNIQMIVNDDEALAYMQQTNEPGFIDLMKFIATHGSAFKDPEIALQAQALLNEYNEVGPRVVLVMVEIPEQDSHDLLRTLSAHKHRCPSMRIEIA